MKLNLFLLLFLFVSIRLYSQTDSIQYSGRPNYVFGRVSAADLKIQSDSRDSGAGAIVLADIGEVHFEDNEAGDRDIVFKRYIRVMITNKQGVTAGEFSIFTNTYTPFHNFMVNPPKPGLSDLKGSTYNIENGQLTESKLEVRDVFTIQHDKTHETKRFVMPALKAGSLFEVRYTIRSNIMATTLYWNFQWMFPCRWSEYDVTIPDGKDYAVKYQGDSNYLIHSNHAFNQSTRGIYAANNISVNHLRWVKQNEPAFQTELFSGSWKNHINRVTLLHNWFVRYYFGQSKGFDITSESWSGFSHVYFMVNNMGEFEKDNYHWLKHDVEKITENLTRPIDKAKSIYIFVRDHYTCNSRTFYFPTHSIKETFHSKTGNAADINLLLTAMLRSIAIEAEPAVLSTVENGYASLEFPLGFDYDYLICIARLDGKDCLLDASYSDNPFGKMKPGLYNGGAATLNSKHSRIVPLVRDSLTDINRTTVILSPDEQQHFSGSFIINCGVQTSFRIRSSLKKMTQKSFFDSLTEKTVMTKLSDETLNHVDDPDQPVSVHSNFEFPENEKTNVIYINPVVFPDFQSNTFNNPNRHQPVDLPWKPDYIYTLSLDIPAGYQVDEMPSSLKIDFNGGDGFFEYSIEKNEDNIQLKTEFKLKKTFFPVEEYKDLRDFVSNIIKKENEQIVFRKKQ